MTIPPQPPPSAPSPPSGTGAGSRPSTPPPPPPRKRKRVRKWLLLTLLVVVLVTTLWTWAAVSIAYETGEQRGFVQKLVHAGWLCKTWEGELSVTPVPGTAIGPTVFRFTIRDDSVATALQRVGGREVALQYGEHRGIPSRCFGETSTFVTGFRELP